MYVYIYIVYDIIYHICNYLQFSEKGKWTKTSGKSLFESFGG